jgi:hypothetical protein
MAGPCAGCGIDTTDGEISLAGARSREWPYGAATIGANSGLFCDPVTGFAWTAPEMLVRHNDDQAGGMTVVPTDTDTILLGEYQQGVIAAIRSNSLVRYDVCGGYAGFRMGDGNWWVLKRYITVVKNGTPVSYSGNEVVNTVENNTGGVLSIGGPVDAQGWWEVVAPLTVIELKTRYTLEVPAHSAHAANGFQWRPPRLSIMAASIPDQ